MKRVVWATDVHLNFLGRPDRRAFAESIVQEAPDAVLLSGDVAESPNVVACLEEMAEIVRRPIYFVLGNHDFYRGSITRTRQAVARAAAESEFLVYLNTQDVVELTPETGLVGHDGWGDARLGDYRSWTARPLPRSSRCSATRPRTISPGCCRKRWRPIPAWWR